MNKFEPYNGMRHELDAQWRKSSYSNSQGNCVEVSALADGSVAVRNSRDPQGPALLYTRAEITALIAAVKDASSTTCSAERPGTPDRKNRFISPPDPWLGDGSAQ